MVQEQDGQTIAGSGWDDAVPEAAWSANDDQVLTSAELRVKENQVHVDHVQDMVPFWMRGVEAAERGEVLKLEGFLETLTGDPWAKSEWKQDTPRRENDSKRKAESRWRSDYDFVEDVARKEPVSEERKRQMHLADAHRGEVEEN